MTNKTMTIGLVLASVPGYSETFFRNKIKGLQQNGFEVILFVNNTKVTFDLCKTYHAPVLSGDRLLAIFNSFTSLFKAVFVHPKRSIKLLQLEKIGGKSFTERLKSLISNQYILSKQLDWLHFGFGTLALGREYVAQAMGAKMAVSFRGFDISIFPVKHPDCYQLLFKRVDKVHVISNDLASLLYKQGLKKEKEVVKITPAIDVAYFQKVTQKDTTPIQLMTVARLHWKKGLEYTLEALAILKEQHISFHYTIIGEGEEWERLVFAAYQLGLAEHITFKGKLPHEEVKTALENVHIYLQYSIQEGFCNAVLEAQAMGLLCIVSNAEGLSENVLDDETGWVVPKRQPALLAKAIKHVIHLPEARKTQIRQKAIERVQMEFHLKQQNAAFLKFYTE
uniref:glycosyltransferase family 4 protein n=1 Tax=Gelidibacter sp. TaxID=2018083 RepID=UPI00404AF8F9